jgi:imidazoleglycerol-phosphate dehydratase/histidinol-phosphatase
MKVLFVDRDGTLIEEPADQQVDRLEKIRFVPGAFAALWELQEAGYTLVMVTNQDGLGTSSFPTEKFAVPQQFILDAYASQGVHFREIFICPHKPSDGCKCRKPKTALVADWIMANGVDLQASAVIGDRETDLEFARGLGCAAHRIRSPSDAAEDWAAAVHELTARRARVSRRTRETSTDVAVDLDHVEPLTLSTGIGFFDHMLEQLGKHGGFSLELRCVGDLHVDEHHTVEDCALALGQALRKALGEKRGVARYGFLLPMDETLAQVAIDLAGRSHFVFEGRFTRETVGQLPTELVPHFFRSLADALGAAVHISVSGDNAHHMVEACFKGVGRALRMALRREGVDLPSTKGVL